MKLTKIEKQLLNTLKEIVDVLRQPEILKIAMNSKLGLEGTLIYDINKVIKKIENKN